MAQGYGSDLLPRRILFSLQGSRCAFHTACRSGTSTASPCSKTASSPVASQPFRTSCAMLLEAFRLGLPSPAAFARTGLHGSIHDPFQGHRVWTPLRFSEDPLPFVLTRLATDSIVPAAHRRVPLSCLARARPLAVERVECASFRSTFFRFRRTCCPLTFRRGRVRQFWPDLWVS